MALGVVQCLAGEFGFFVVGFGSELVFVQAQIQRLGFVACTDQEQHAVFEGQPIQQFGPRAEFAGELALIVGDGKVDQHHIGRLGRSIAIVVFHAPHGPPDQIFRE